GCGSPGRTPGAGPEPTSCATGCDSGTSTPAGGAFGPCVWTAPGREAGGMFEVRVHGRCGQGVVTAAELLSVAAFLEGRHAQAFPSFGSERMGARKRLLVVPATELAQKHLGRPMPNAALLGGFAALTGVVELRSVVTAISG